MKINSVALSAVPSYKTAFVSIAHLSPEDSANLAALSTKGYYFCHNVENDGSAYIVRFGQVAPELADIVTDLVGEYGFSEEFADFMRLLADAGFDAAHFDPEMDLVQGQTWYTDSGTKVVPLAYDEEIINYYSLSEEQRQAVLSVYDEEFAEQTDFVFVGGAAHAIADCMRLDGESEMREYGFSGSWAESNTSAIFCMLSDDSETADIVRVF